MPIKRSKATARGKMPSEAQAAFMYAVADSPEQSGCWSFYGRCWFVNLKPTGVDAYTVPTAKRCVAEGWLETRGLKEQLYLTPAGREVLKRMERP